MENQGKNYIYTYFEIGIYEASVFIQREFSSLNKATAFTKKVFDGLSESIRPSKLTPVLSYGKNSNLIKLLKNSGLRGNLVINERDKEVITNETVLFYAANVNGAYNIILIPTEV